MWERPTDDRIRTLLYQIDERLREAERLRNHVTHTARPIWPDRRETIRVPDPSRTDLQPEGGEAA